MLETLCWLPTVLRVDAGGVTTTFKALCGLVSSAVTSASLHPGHISLLCPTTLPVPETIYTTFPHVHFKFLFNFYHLNEA